jgi:hypothetical protein
MEANSKITEVAVRHSSGAVTVNLTDSSSESYFVMKGGEISGNIASGTTVSNIGDSPAVLLGRKGKFTMNGGLITNNTRGVVISGPEAEFTMEGGFITNNGTVDPAPPPDPPNPRGLRGGGVCVGVNLTGGTFKMNGGEISGNGVNPAVGALDTPGGGVYVAAKNGYPTFDGEIAIASANHVCLTSASPGQYPFITLGDDFTNNPGDEPITLDLAATRPEWVSKWVEEPRKPPKKVEREFTFKITLRPRCLIGHSLVTACFSCMFKPMGTPSMQRPHVNSGNMFREARGSLKFLTNMVYFCGYE